MNCEQAMTLISAQIDGEIQPDDQARLDSHLHECADCRAMAEAFHLQDAELRRTFAPRREAAAATAERVLAQVESPATPTRSQPSPSAQEQAERLRIIRRRLACVMGAAATVAAIALCYHALQRKPHAKTPPFAFDTAGMERLIPRPRLPAPTPTRIAVGQELRTTAGQRHRVALPDGSLLYLNQNTIVRLNADRRLSLSTGEVFLEVSPRDQETGSTFVVQTPEREVFALGTKFAVRADEAGTGVVVTQGKVKVSGSDSLVYAGQQMPADGGRPGPAPRASHILDWTRELMAAAESPLVPDSKYSGGALVAVDPYGQEAKLSLRKYHVDVHIEDGFARTTIDQTYFNHAPWRLEGTFYFPLPPDNSLSRLAMYVDGNLMEGGMVERDYGRAVFETIVSRQKDPALLEWLDGSTFKMRVFPLEARQEKRIVLSYTQKLSALYGRISYRFPAGHSLEVVRDWKFHAVVKGGAHLVPTSPTHPDMKVVRNGKDLVLDDAARSIKVDRDVALDLHDPSAGNQTKEITRFSAAEHEGARYLMLRYRPHLPSQPVRQRRDWVFLFESSGDRDPLLARVQIEVIRSLLANAEHDDTFAILTAGTFTRTLAARPQEATAENVQAALAFLEQAHLIGALNLGSALEAAEPFLKEGQNPYLVHVGSGIAAMGERQEDVLAKRLPDGVRYVGVGVGKRWSRSFMKLAAERSGGYFTQINPDEPISWRGFELLATLNTPRLLDVKVVDNTEKATFLSYASLLTQGEELCAITRIEADEKIPEAVTVTGTLDGKPFNQVIPVRDVAEKAGYLPRTWAKLEIDRLLAEDAVKNKGKIVSLSKAMYVMTPYTSLLVLENEEMYREFKVDRGRKDHWAMYPCPEKDEVVYEPDPNQPFDPRAPRQTGQKPPATQVVQTLIVRTPPRFLNWPTLQNGRGVQFVFSDGSVKPIGRTSYASVADANKVPGADWVVLQSLTGHADGDPVPSDELEASNEGRGPWRGIRHGTSLSMLIADNGRLWDRELALREVGRPMNGAPRGGININTVGRADIPFPDEPAIMFPPAARWSAVTGNPVSKVVFSSDGRLLVSGGQDSTVRLWNATTGLNGQIPSEVAGAFRDLKSVRSSGDRPLGVDRLEVPSIFKDDLRDLSRGIGGVRTGSLLFADGWQYRGYLSGPVPLLDDSGSMMTGKLLKGEEYGIQQGSPLGYGGMPPLYRRPYFSGDERIFSDLASYAPGMNTSQADVEAIIEAEAAPSLNSLPGRIDDDARKLIEQARTAGWRTLTIPGKDGRPDFTILFDGRGRYAYERTLPLGLRERVACDGDTLLHLYPELGIGARRSVSRAHRAELADLVPWVLPPAEDLARGVDVLALDKQTVALAPRDVETAKNDKGEPAGYLCVHLLFAANGSLAERRLVAMPPGTAVKSSKGKVVLRETYDANGVVKVHDKDDKELSVHKWSLTATQEPDLKPDTAKLVVLNLPLRSREHVYQRLDLDPHQPLEYGENACFEYLEADDAFALFTAEYAANQGARAKLVYQKCFSAHGVRLPGFYTLLAACGAEVSSDPELVALLQEQPRDQLLGYLAMHQNRLYGLLQRRWNLNLGDTLGPRESFLQRLAEFRDLTLRWQYAKANQGSDAARRAEQERALDFVRRNKSSALGWALLGLMDHRAWGDERFHRTLADAWRLYDDKPGLAYAARYEQAYSLLKGDRRPEARRRYRELYEQTFKDGILPPIDSTFLSALQSDGKDADEWNALLRQTAAALVEKKHRPAAVVLAWQCWQLEDEPLAHNLLTVALDGMTEDADRLVTTLTAIEFLWQTQQYTQAQSLVESLLANSKFAEWAALWRLGSQIAEQRGLTARAIECLERALDIEYQHLPDVINLQVLRSDYGKLLAHYETLAQAAASLKVEPPRDLVARTVRATDRWRALDRDYPDACQPAGRILKIVGADELAWEYLTTPIGLRPGESQPWWNLAQTLSREGSLALADRAYATAFEAEPTNALILWDRAQNLRQAGRPAEAKKLYRQIADGAWQPRFSGIQTQARWQLEGR